MDADFLAVRLGVRPVKAVFAAAVAVAILAGACRSSTEPAERSQSDSGPALSKATDCDSVVREPTFAPDAEVVVETVSGRIRGCTIQVPANSPVLERLGIWASCPPEASILVPLENEEGEGWHVDFAELRELDNGDCLNH